MNFLRTFSDFSDDSSFSSVEVISPTVTFNLGALLFFFVNDFTLSSVELLDHEFLGRQFLF